MLSGRKWCIIVYVDYEWKELIYLQSEYLMLIMLLLRGRFRGYPQCAFFQPSCHLWRFPLHSQFKWKNLVFASFTSKKQQQDIAGAQKRCTLKVILHYNFSVNMLQITKLDTNSKLNNWTLVVRQDLFVVQLFLFSFPWSDLSSHRLCFWFRLYAYEFGSSLFV